MDWISIESLRTVGGAAAAVTLVTAVAKKVIPALTGRWTQLVAFGLSLGITGVVGTWTSGSTALVSLLNACVIYAAAVGIEQTLTYKKAD